MTRKARSESEQAPADLTEAARAVVRDPGDPRIDAHLAALGLGQDDVPKAGLRPRGDTAAAAQNSELRLRIGELEAQLEARRARLRSLAIMVIVALVVILLLLIVLVLR